MKNKHISSVLTLYYRLVRYNFKVIFAGKFLYFLLAAMAFFLIVSGIMVYNNALLEQKDIFYLLIYPGMLLTFYPTVFGIQNDDDARMLEIIFGIPNYRYKVWLIRFVLIYVMIYIILFLLALLTNTLFVPFRVMDMAFHLMFPLFFIGSMSFMFSTVVRNGNGTAVVMIIIGMFLFILGGTIDQSEWNVFFNPFDMPSNLNETIWDDRVFDNRLYLFCAGVVTLFAGLIFLQRREKFI